MMPEFTMIVKRVCFLKKRVTTVRLNLNVRLQLFDFTFTLTQIHVFDLDT
jgi:hypothetical protein